MSIPRPIITLLTDFGDRDSYVGAMKGVILSMAPDAQLVDITHLVRPQDIQQAALILASVYPYFPPHTIHLVVVDPGVGTERRPVALATAHGFFVAPDNGVLTYVLMQEPTAGAILLDRSGFWLPEPSHTFHGRDVFSPVAAHLANGVQLADMGTEISDLVMLTLPPLHISPTAVRGEVIRIDRFGNVLTNIMRLQWVDETTVELNPLSGMSGARPAPFWFDARKARVTFSWHSLSGLHRTYDQVTPGQSLALIGSNGELEIAINQGSACDKLALKEGDAVSLLLET